MSLTEEYTIVFTDSGLGGLSIMADFYNDVRKIPHEPEVLNIVFFNALQAQNYGYNRISNMDTKAEIFNAALESLLKLYQPQKIAIACNTLSALYPKTKFSKKNLNVVEIISCGKLLIEQYQKNHNQIPLFVLATPTTIAAGAFKTTNKKTIQISGENLASLIEFNFMTPELREKVTEIVQKIKHHLAKNVTFSLFLGCTHYSYIIGLFKNIATAMGLKIYSILDPAHKFNKILINSLPKSPNNKHTTKINIKIESQAKILAEEIQSISTLIYPRSPEISSLLKTYTRLPVTF